MKFKSLFFIGCLTLLSTAYADDRYIHPATTPADAKAAKNMMTPGYCEIEVLNRSYDDVRVYGVYDDFTPMKAFKVYSYGSAVYISLFYNGYCHSGMNLFVDNWDDDYNIFTGYVKTNTTLRIVPYYNLTNKLKVEILPK